MANYRHWLWGFAEQRWMVEEAFRPWKILAVSLNLSISDGTRLVGGVFFVSIDIPVKTLA